jgi:adenylate cyclase
MTTAKHRTRIKRIIPFGIIWLVFGVVYSIMVKGILAESSTYPATGIPYDFKSSLVITSLASTLMGLLAGTLEVYVLHRLFSPLKFWAQIAMKALTYTAAIILFLMAINTIYLGQVLDLPIYHPDIIHKNVLSFSAPWFWSIVVYIGTITTVSLLFIEFQQFIGHGVIRNFFTGRYHTPKEEERIFMFLDMKSSTTIAEQMGHVKYFGLLNRYYADMTEAILASSGEICQYVGDEAVITWTLSDGLRNNDCLECFFRIKEELESKVGHYTKAFGRVPGFKAGLHCGHVTTGEIGSVWKDIVFTGDVMNTTARIQSLCNENGVDLLVSEAMLSRMRLGGEYRVREIGVRELKGKDEKVKLFTVGK